MSSSAWGRSPCALATLGLLQDAESHVIEVSDVELIRDLIHAAWLATPTADTEARWRARDNAGSAPPPAPDPFSDGVVLLRRPGATP
jgi:hypothetical protein